MGSRARGRGVEGGTGVGLNGGVERVVEAELVLVDVNLDELRLGGKEARAAHRQSIVNPFSDD
jgi:hypothetical protein